MGRRIVKMAMVILFLLGTMYVAFQVSPYPSVWIIRYFFEKEAKTANDRLSEFVPEYVSGIADIGYDKSDPDALLDVYYPKDAATKGELLPLIVWTHGGGLISGKKEHLENYCRMLAGEGFVVAAIDYTVAPTGKYPLPVRQLNSALGFLSTKASSYHADASRIILAGDSGGAMLSAQMANIISSEKYAKMVGVIPKIRLQQLKGTLLYCGIYDVTNLNTGGEFGGFLKTVLWAYFGKKDISDDRYAQSASVNDYLTPNSSPPVLFPPGIKIHCWDNRNSCRQNSLSKTLLRIRFFFLRIITLNSPTNTNLLTTNQERRRFREVSHSSGT